MRKLFFTIVSLTLCSIFFCSVNGASQKASPEVKEVVDVESVWYDDAEGYYTDEEIDTAVVDMSQIEELFMDSLPVTEIIIFPDFSSEESVKSFMEEHYPGAYKIFLKVREYYRWHEGRLDMLNFYKKFAQWVRSSEEYEGDVITALEDLDQIAYVYTTGPQQQINFGMSEYLLNRKLYNAMILDRIVTYYPEYEYLCDNIEDLFYEMECYLVNVTYGEPKYSAQPMEFYEDMKDWQNKLTNILYSEAVSLGLYEDSDLKSLDETLGNNDNNSVTTVSDAVDEERMKSIIQLLDYYREERQRFSNTLPSSRREAYEKLGNPIYTYLENQIAGLKKSRNANLIGD